MIPYIPEPTFFVGEYEVETFTFLVMLALLVQFEIVIRRAPREGFTRATAATLVCWAIGLGLVFAHVFDVFWYTPHKLVDDPLFLFQFWASLSSFGGMVGGLAGIYAVMRYKRMSGAEMFRFFDLLIYALPFTLAIGRLGCALKHDHPGVSSDHLLAVAFPDGPRFDLGLLEFVYVSGVAIVFAALGRQPRPTGFYIGAFFALYGPVRFAMDTLRVSEARYAGWTPGQYLSILATVVGLAVLGFVVQSTRRRHANA